MTELYKVIKELVSYIDAQDKRIESLNSRIEELECKIEGLEEDFEDNLLNSDTIKSLEEKIIEISEPQGFLSDIGSQSLIDSYKNQLESILHRLDKLEEEVNK